MNRDEICLLHYCCSRETVRRDTHVKKTPDVIDATALEQQFEAGGVRELWSKAVGDVVMRMYKAQKEEQKMSRDDPLAMLNLDAHPINLALIATEKKASTNKGELELQRNNKAVTVDNRIGQKGIWHHKSPAALDAFVAKNSSSDAATFALRNFGDICTSCESANTVRKFRPYTYDVAKNETWGSSMAPDSIFDVICNDCGDVVTRNE